MGILIILIERSKEETMKKLLVILIYLVGICAGGWAQKSGAVDGERLGALVGEVLAKETKITRDAKDFRILYFLGKKYEMYLGNPSIMSYFNKDGDGIVISKQEAILEQVLHEGLETFRQAGYTIKSQDGRNPADVIYSVYKQKGDEIKYKVVRLFPIGNNRVIEVVVGKKITQKDPLPLMRKVMRGVRTTPQEVLSAPFPKGYCKLGEDCY